MSFGGGKEEEGGAPPGQPEVQPDGSIMNVNAALEEAGDATNSQAQAPAKKKKKKKKKKAAANVASNEQDEEAMALQQQ